MTQNTYLYVQEKYILQADLDNLAAHFSRVSLARETGPTLSAFPKDKVRDRVCYILQKYQ